jgi:hypothetical protein
MPQVTRHRLLLGAAAAGAFMKHAVSRFSRAVLVAVALYNTPAVAQEHARTQAIRVYCGAQFGDRLTDRQMSPIEGQLYAQPVVITYGNGVTANLGIGTQYYVTPNLFWDLGIRYRSLDRVGSLEFTLLTTAGAGTA